MSIQTRGIHEGVACDLCGATSRAGDTRFRLMRRDTAGKSHHLCPNCRVWAEWCEAHQQYHRPDDLHRRACANCGGLFTSRVRLHIAHCPGCLRAIAPQPAAHVERPRPAAHTARGLAGLFASLTRTLRH